MKDAALQYLGMGLKPIPLCWPDQHGQCACPKRHKNEKEIGKAPLLDGGYQDVKVTEEKVEQWWTRWPQANIGILLEPSNLLVVDMDGEEAIKEGSQRLPLAPTLASGNGEHRWFLSPGIHTRVTKRGKSRGIDILSLGYTIAPPSRHRNGRQYRWKVYPDGIAWEGEPLEETPRGVVRILQQAVEKRGEINSSFNFEKTGLPKIDVNKEPISNYLKRLIIEGDFKGKHPSRSEAHFEAITLMLAEEWPPEKIGAVLLNPEYKIGEKIRERGSGRAEEFAAREVAKAKATFDPSKIKSNRRQHLQLVDGSAALETVTELNPPMFQKKHIININDQPIHVLAAAGWDALKDKNDPPELFVRNWMMTEVRTDRQGRARLFEVSEAGLRGRLDRSASWVRWKKKGDDMEEVPTQPPLYVVKDMLADPDMPLPTISGITHAPIFSQDGTLETEPGYHPKSELYYIATDDMEIPAVSEEPDQEEVREAIDLFFNEMLIDFPFKDTPSRVNTLATILLPFCRPMIKGPTPLHLIDAPKRGTGKSLLARAIHMVATGMDAPMDKLPKNDEETDKKIVSILRDGRPIVVLDNATGNIERDSLNAVLTSTRYSGRILSKSEMVELPNNATWIMTGNNVDLDGDIHRRVAWIRLDTKMDRPYTRKEDQFHHTDLIEWIEDNRGLLVWAALTLIQNWIAKGRPRGDERLGSFEGWSRVMSGILKAAGVSGFLGNRDELFEMADQEGLMWEGFVEKWWTEHGESPVPPNQLWKLAVNNDMLDSVLGDGNERSQKTRFGMEMRKQQDRIYGNFRLCGKRDNHRKTMIYWLVKMEK